MRQEPHDRQQPQPPQPPQPPPQPLAQPRQPRQPLQPPQPLPQPRATCSPSRDAPAFSLSKTKNVPRLTSEISSSVRANPGPVAVSFDGMSVTEPAVAADAPLASDKDTPTTPNAGTTSFRRFRFEACFVTAIVESSMNSSTCSRSPRSRRVGFALTPWKAEPLAGTHRRCAGFRLHEPQTACNNRFHEHHMNDIVRFPPESRVVSDSVALTRTEIIDSVPIPKFASLRCTLVCELRNRRTIATY